MLFVIDGIKFVFAVYSIISKPVLHNLSAIKIYCLLLA